MLKFAIVTPSYNQCRYISEAIESVLMQKGNFSIDYIVVDGQSTDNTVSILKEYEQKLNNGSIEIKCNSIRFRWISESDKGQYDAINKGFSLVDGNIMAWINSDDKYTPWAFSVVSNIFAKFKHVEWISSLHPLTWNNKGQAIVVGNYEGFNREAFFRGVNLCINKWFQRKWIAQDSTFWRHQLWNKIEGGLKIDYDYAADFDLWSKFYKKADLYGVGSPLAGYRFHEVQKTSDSNRYNREAEEIFYTHNGKPYGKLESFLRKNIFRLMVKKRFTKKILRKMKLLYSVRNIYSLNNKGEWHIIENYIQ